MDFLLQQYYDTLAILNKLLDEETNRPLSLRDPLRIEVLCDEIQDVLYAIRGIERKLDDKLGYRPRRSTLMSRADLYVAMSKDG